MQNAGQTVSGLEKARVVWRRRKWVGGPGGPATDGGGYDDHVQPELSGARSEYGGAGDERAGGAGRGGERPESRAADGGGDGVSAGAAGGRPAAVGGAGGADQRVQDASQ